MKDPRDPRHGPISWQWLLHWLCFIAASLLWALMMRVVRAHLERKPKRIVLHLYEHSGEACVILNKKLDLA